MLERSTTLQFAESVKLEQSIKANLKGLGYSLGGNHDKH